MKQEISIFINGKAKQYKECERERHNNPNKEIIEVAAALEETSSKEITLLTVPLKKSELFFKRKKFSIGPQKQPRFSFRNNDKSFSKQILAAIMAAVITGTALGLLVLMVFSTDITEAGGNKSVTSTEVQKQLSQTTGKTVKLPAITLELSALQAGVFSSTKTAEDAVKSFEDKGYSASILPIDGDKFSVLIGIGNKKHYLEGYKADFEKQMGEKTLSKTFTFSFTDLKTTKNVDASYFTNGNILLQNVLTLSQISKSNETMLDHTLDEFNKWKEHGKAQEENWDKDTAKAASDYEKQLEGAFLALKEDKKDKVNWAFQQKAMDSFQAYKNLLNTLK
jgi:hypothetical protein